MLATTEQLIDAGWAAGWILVAWTLCSLAVYDLLVLGRGWGDERYQAWLTDALARELLASGTRAHGPESMAQTDE